jgi:hypothetical protein
MELKNKKVKSLLPQGINTIEHSARLKLGLNCEEYCIFDTILSRKKKDKKTIFDDIQNHTGLLPSVINIAIFTMTEINLIKTKDSNFMLNTEMVHNAFKEQNDMYEEEFKQFWKKDNVNCWPGPKELAFSKFKIARKKHSFEFIMKQKEDYFVLLEHETWRRPMQASKFLNVNTGQIKEDWKSQWPANAIKTQKETKPITIEEKDSLYK